MESEEEERRRLREAVDRISAAGRFAPTTPEVLLRADRAESEADLTPQDAIVHASVVLQAASRPGAAKCFLNRNSRDFMNPNIQAELGQEGGCRLLFSFRDGLAFITHARQ